MKKLFLITLVLVSGLLISSCSEDNPVNPVDQKGSIQLDSNPQGAQIWIDGVNTGQVTPATVEAEVGVRDVTLILAGYVDDVFSITVQAGQTSIVTNRTLTQLGNLFVQSTPSGAQIWLSGSNTGEVTPFTFTGLDDGSYELTLKLDTYRDTTLTANVSAGNLTNANVVLTPTFIVYSIPVRIWETTGTTAAQPSGLDLSSGNAYGISSTDNNKVDIYYFSNSAGDTYLVQSAGLNANMSRDTYFKVAAGSNLNDGVDSPAKDGTWTTSMSDRETSYVFLYDADGHYSKLKIDRWGGGIPGEPAWVEVVWIYSGAVNNTIF